MKAEEGRGERERGVVARRASGWVAGGRGTRQPRCPVLAERRASRRVAQCAMAGGRRQTRVPGQASDTPLPLWLALARLAPLGATTVTS